MTVALAAVSCLALLPAVASRRYRVLQVFEFRNPDLRPCLALASLGLAALVALSAGPAGGYLVGLTAPVSLLLEEFIFRGLPLAFLLRSRDSARSRWAVIIISSLTFSGLHFSPLPIMYLDRFVFACLALVIAVKFNSLWPSVLYHAVANITALTTSEFFFRPSYAWMYIPLDILIFAAVFLFCSKSSIKRTPQPGPVKVL
jgi:membrane protease YdiL (CAAX protease family)